MLIGSRGIFVNSMCRRIGESVDEAVPFRENADVRGADQRTGSRQRCPIGER